MLQADPLLSSFGYHDYHDENSLRQDTVWSHLDTKNIDERSNVGWGNPTLALLETIKGHVQMSRNVSAFGALVVWSLLVTLDGAALAQKYPGETIPIAPAPAPYIRPTPPPAARVPVYPPVASPTLRPPPPPAMAPQVGAERDVEARRLASELPLDPGTANLQGRMPADVRGTIGRLGIRVPNGSRTDLRNQSPSREGFINALRH